jgi:predicted house-cleaning noncanonical NTP pyrophosphatase (MazG superfamily)
MYSRVPTFQFSTDYRTVVFRKYLTIFLKKHKENIRKYVDNKNFEKMEDSELWTSLLSLINDIIYDYEKEMELAGIPKVIIEKMKVKNNDTISLTIDLIEGICNSQFYSSDKNLLKIYSILNIMLSILENTISNSDHICNSINGQLKGMSMDGKTEP